MANVFEQLDQQAGQDSGDANVFQQFDQMENQDLSKPSDEQPPASGMERAARDYALLKKSGMQAGGIPGSMPTQAIEEALSVSPQTVANAMDVVKGAGRAAYLALAGPVGKGLTLEDVQREYMATAAQKNRAPSTGEQVAAGLQNVGAGVAAGFTDPVQAAAMVSGAAVPELASKVIPLAFAADMARHVPEQARQAGTASVNGSAYDQAKAYAALGLTGVMAPALAAGALAPEAPKPDTAAQPMTEAPAKAMQALENAPVDATAKPAAADAMKEHADALNLNYEGPYSAAEGGQQLHGFSAKEGPAKAASFTVPENATREQIKAAVDEKQAQFAEPDPPAEPSKEVSDWTDKFVAGEKINNTDPVTGTRAMFSKVKTIADLDKIAESFDAMRAKSKAAKEAWAAETDPAKKAALFNDYAKWSFSQYGRELVEAATNTGGWQEGKSKIIGNLGERPLDAAKNPEVAAWLDKNANRLGIAWEPKAKPAEAAPTPEGLKPAIKVNGKLFTGDDHVKAYENAKNNGQPDTSGAQEGFVNSQGEFVSREDAAKTSGVETKKEPGKLHSSDLKREQEKASEPVGMGGATPSEFPPSGNPDTFGIAARVREQRAQAGRTEPLPPGEGISAPDSVNRGRELLAKNPEAAESSMADFEKTGKLSSDDMALARAKGEQLEQESRKTEENFGTDSDEWRAAFKKMSDWDARSKKMQTEWHKTGMAQQGETDIDTGSFTGLAREFKSQTGKDFTPDQARTAKQKASASRTANKNLDDARQSLFSFIDAIKPKPGDPNTTVWKRAKEYIGRGMDDFDDMRHKLATDLGMKVEDVTKALASDKKVKRAADDVWRKQQVAQQMKANAKRWIAETNFPEYKKWLAAVPKALFNLKIGFGLHGFVPLGTHVPMGLFKPPIWDIYFKNYGRMAKMVVNPAFYENMMQDLQRRPNYIPAQRGGLQNNPHEYEEFSTPDSLKFLGGKSGSRGYAILKVIRQDLFDREWDKLPKTSQTPEMAKALADDVNHFTGVTSKKAPKALSVGLFAPRLEASRVMWLAGDPAKAVETFANWKKASEADKAFAVRQVKEKAWVAGTAFTLLAANQALLNASGSKQKINGIPKEMGGAGFDPMSSDFLKFKGAGMEFSYGNAMLSMARLPVRLFAIREGNGGKLKNLIYPDEDTYNVLGQYARTQLSPAAGLAMDLWLKSDYQSRPLPNSTRPVPKRLRAQGVKPYTWSEFWTAELSPIPASEAAKEVWKAEFGASEDQMRDLQKAAFEISVMATTGGRLTDDPRLKKEQQ